MSGALKSHNLAVFAFMHKCARFSVEITTELYFPRLKMVKQKEISVENRAQIIILQKNRQKLARKSQNIETIFVFSSYEQFEDIGKLDTILTENDLVDQERQIKESATKYMQ